MKTLLVVHYIQEVEKFKYILPGLGDVHVVYDTEIGLSNAKQWQHNGKMTTYNVGVPRRPWWYILARHCDDYRFWKKLPQSEYYKNRARQSYGSYKHLVWLPLGWLKRLYRVPEYILEHVKKLSPDVLITTSLSFPPLHIQAEYVMAAKELGIPVISMLTNHDALTTKSVMWPKPDYLFLWNGNHSFEATMYHGIRASQIEFVGAFSFEHWLNVRPTRRDKFCAKWGLDINKPIYTYLTSSNSISGLEVGATEQWRDAMKNNGQLVVRAHPDKVHLMAGIPGVTAIPNVSEGTFTQEAFQLAVDTYAHSEACYGINTSVFIEASLVGTPCYSLDVRLEDKLSMGGQSGIHFRQLKEILGEDSPKLVREWLGIGKELPSSLIVKKIIAIIE